MTHHPLLSPTPANDQIPAPAPGPCAMEKGTLPQTPALYPSNGPQAQNSSAPAPLASNAAPARPLSSTPETAPADWGPFVEEILDSLADRRHSVWAFLEPRAAKPAPDHRPVAQASNSSGAKVHDEPVACGAEEDVQDAATEDTDDEADDDEVGIEPDWDHPEDDPVPEDPLAFLDALDMRDIFGPDIPQIPPRPDPRAGLIPRVLPLLATLAIARSFGSLAALRDRLCAQGAISLVTSGDSALDEAVLSVLDAILTKGSLAPEEGVAIILAKDCTNTRPRDDRVFPGLSDTLTKAILGGRAILLVSASADGLPTPIVELAPKVIRLASIDDVMIAHAAKHLRPDWGRLDPDDLPPASELADLPLSVLVLALRAPDVTTFRARIATACAPAPMTTDQGPGLRDFPLPGPVREAVDQMIADLADWRAGRLQWSAVTRGLLLHGGPGTGKTQLARLIAREAGIPVHATSLAKMQAAGARGGDTVREMRAVFARAVENAPSIVFIDELDAFGDRDRPLDQNSSWTSSVVGALLECLDGFDANEGVITIAATNHPDRIDAALRRPGRFDRMLTLGNPDPDQLPAALRWHLYPDLVETDLTQFALQLIGASGADIASLVRAARATARRRREPLGIQHLRASLAQIRPPLDEALRWRVAVHEAGHAIAAHASGLGTPRRIAIHASGGYVETPNISTSPTKAEIDAALITLMSGRAAERLFLGEVSAGAGGAEDSDLAKATELATAMETTFGLTERLIWRAAPKDVDKVLNDDTDLRNRVEERLKDAEHRAMALLGDRKERLQKLARELAGDGMLDGDRLLGLLASEGRTCVRRVTVSVCPNDPNGAISP